MTTIQASHRDDPMTPQDSAFAWHGMTLEDCFKTLESQSTGLTDSDADSRLRHIGPNRLPEPSARSIWMRIFDQFNNVLIHVLLAAAIMASMLGHATDALVILAVVVLNAMIGLIQEGRAEKALDSIQHMVDPSARVWCRADIRAISSRSIFCGTFTHMSSPRSFSA
jgi:magnesium-transporting ATPase (P-type)